MYHLASRVLCLMMPALSFLLEQTVSDTDLIELQNVIAIGFKFFFSYNSGTNVTR